MAVKLYRVLKPGVRGPDVHGAKRSVYRLLGRKNGKLWKYYLEMKNDQREFFGPTFLRHLLRAQRQLGIKRSKRGRFNPETLAALRKKDAVDSTAELLLKEAWPPPIPPKVHPIPEGHTFSLVGYPGQGTHNASDWQSRNALDFKASSGTPVLAPRAGRVVRVGGSDGIKFVGVKIIFGRKLTIETDEGPDIFLTHLARVSLRDGDRVKAGDVVGKIGWFGAGSHTHISFAYGDPREMLGWKRIKV